MAFVIQGRFPVQPDGTILVVLASSATPPFTYLNGMKFDATGAVVVSG